MGRTRPTVAVLGGSFDRLHAGHRALLAAAFAEAEQVGIGVTTDVFLREHPKPLAGRIQTYTVRRRALERYLRSQYPTARWWIVPLSDPWGRSVEPGVDVLVASAETARAAAAVNDVRRERKLPPVRLRLVGLVRAQDGLALSSRRIRAGAVDPEGRRLRPLTVRAVGVPIERLREVSAAFRSTFPEVPVRMVRSLVDTASDQARAKGPSARARDAAVRGALGVDYAVGFATGRRSNTPGSRGPSWVAIASSEGAVVRPVGRRATDGVTAAVMSALRAARPT